MSMHSRRQFLAGVGALAAVGAAQPATETASQPKYRLGLVTYNIAATWDIPTLLRVCRTIGLGPVELRTTHRHGVEPSLSPAARREVRQQFADAGVEIWGCGSVCEFHSPDRQVVQQNIDTCRQFVQLAADLGAKGVKVRPNGLPRDVPVEKTLEQIGKALTECGRAANDAGVEIWVEVHGAGTSLPQNCHTMMQHCNHPRVGLTWNSNPTDVANGSVADAFRLLRPWIKSCHINELPGPYPYRELFRLFRETGYDRVTLAEIQGAPDLPSSERLLRYYKALWTELARG
jgi:sugar phosphate isomerase/epimerase